MNNKFILFFIFLFSFTSVFSLPNQAGNRIDFIYTAPTYDNNSAYVNYSENSNLLDGFDSSYFYPASNPNGYISTESDPICTANLTNYWRNNDTSDAKNYSTQGKIVSGRDYTYLTSGTVYSLLGSNNQSINIVENLVPSPLTEYAVRQYLLKFTSGSNVGKEFKVDYVGMDGDGSEGKDYITLNPIPSTNNTGNTFEIYQLYNMTKLSPDRVTTGTNHFKVYDADIQVTTGRNLLWESGSYFGESDLGFIYYSGSPNGARFMYGASLLSFTYEGTTGNVSFFKKVRHSSNAKITLGNSDNAEIYYPLGSNANLIINPRAVGNGNLTIMSNTNQSGYNVFSTGNITPQTTNSASIGSSVLRYLKGWFSGLDITGHLNQTSGNATINNYYGGMWNYTDAGYTITLGGVGVSSNLSNFIADMNNGFAVISGDALNITTSSGYGTYKIDYAVSFSAGATGTYDWDIVVNGVIIDKCRSHQSGNGPSTESNVASGCFITLNSTRNYINLQVHDDTNPVQNPTIYASNVRVLRVGN